MQKVKWIFSITLYCNLSCKKVMDNKNMDIDPSILDADDEDDTTTTGRDSISSLFVWACGIGPEEVFEDQQCASTP